MLQWELANNLKKSCVQPQFFNKTRSCQHLLSVSWPNNCSCIRFKRLIVYDMSYINLRFLNLPTVGINSFFSQSHRFSQKPKWSWVFLLIYIPQDLKKHRCSIKKSHELLLFSNFRSASNFLRSWIRVYDSYFNIVTSFDYYWRFHRIRVEITVI